MYTLITYLSKSNLLSKKKKMGNPRAFISFDFDNNQEEKRFFAGQAKNSKTPFNIEDWSSKDHLPQNQWEKLINEKVRKCNLMIVLVGKKTANAKGVLKEIQFARNNNVPVFGVYVGGANNLSDLPIGLSRSRTITWVWESIARQIDQCMSEGKNNI